MSVAEITEEIKPLSRQEKLSLLEEISKMLQEEEMLEYFTPGAIYPVETPMNAEKAAAQLQHFLEQHQI